MTRQPVHETPNHKWLGHPAGIDMQARGQYRNWNCESTTSAAAAFAAGLTNRVTPRALQFVTNIHQRASANRTRSIRRTNGVGRRAMLVIVRNPPGIDCFIRRQDITFHQVESVTENRPYLSERLWRHRPPPSTSPNETFCLHPN